ncbi:hypothetical protein D3C73_1602780 [compost metagenome]
MNVLCRLVPSRRSTSFGSVYLTASSLLSIFRPSSLADFSDGERPKYSSFTPGSSSPVIFSFDPGEPSLAVTSVSSYRS